MIFNKIFKKRWLVRLLFFFTFISIFPETSFSYEQQINSFISGIEQEALDFDDEVLQSLYDYKTEVANTAYEKTLRLCEGYRRVKGLVSPGSHAAGPAEYHGGYLYDDQESMSAWLTIIGHGAAQPFNSIAGLKADYLIGNQIGFWDFRTWFGSMYATYLVGSFGFLGAAVHCLGTMNQSRINDFAATILIVDYRMSLLTHAGVTITAGAALNLIFRATRFVLSPVSRMIRHAGQRIGTTPFRIGAITIGVTAADNFMMFMSKQDEYKEMTAQVFDQDSDLNQLSERNQRFLILHTAFLEIEKYAKIERENCQEAPDTNICRAVYDPFKAFIKENFNLNLIDEMKADRRVLRVSNRRTQDEFSEAYLMLLDAFLPIVEEFYFS